MHLVKKKITVCIRVGLFLQSINSYLIYLQALFSLDYFSGEFITAISYILNVFCGT